mmetsp:Transcript_38196/g.88621  ORF Transcript_38196/g.88621 Transcript_38196/m.88621 type:complete len:242 (+) Transcript_38196:97-822(+)
MRIGRSMLSRNRAAPAGWSVKLPPGVEDDGPPVAAEPGTVHPLFQEVANLHIVRAPPFFPFQRSEELAQPHDGNRCWHARGEAKTVAVVYLANGMPLRVAHGIRAIWAMFGLCWCIGLWLLAQELLHEVYSSRHTGLGTHLRRNVHGFGLHPLVSHDCPELLSQILSHQLIQPICQLAATRIRNPDAGRVQVTHRCHDGRCASTKRRVRRAHASVVHRCSTAWQQPQQPYCWQHQQPGLRL